MSNAIASLAKQTVAAQANAAKTKAQASAKKTGAQKAATRKTAVAPSTAVKARIVTGRPGSGKLLFAYTHAVFTLTGLMDGKTAAKAQLEALSGMSAIAHHVREGRVERTEGGYKLTAGGKAHFQARIPGIDQAAVDAYTKVLTTGKPDGQFIKSANHIAAL